mgnify:CR=1 FL=1
MYAAQALLDAGRPVEALAAVERAIREANKEAAYAFVEYALGTNDVDHRARCAQVARDHAHTFSQSVPPCIKIGALWNRYPRANLSKR